MPVKIKPLTKQQLFEYFKVYRDAFPDWAVENDVVLVRRRGPIEQCIAFEALRDGAYRPSSSVALLVTRGVHVHILSSFLDIKHREILPREHLVKWPRIVKAMEEQFQPPIRRPLDVAEVLRLGEQEVARDRIENVNYFSGLAALNAYVGDAERALFWCNRVEEQLKKRDIQPTDWELRRAQFTRQLHEAIDRRQERTFLEEISRQQG